MIRQVFEKSPFQPNHLISGWNMTKNNHPQKGCPVENPNRWPRRCCFPSNPGAKFVRQQPKAGHLWSGQTSSEGSDLQKGYLGILEGFLRFFFLKPFISSPENDLLPYQLMIFPTYPPSDNGPWIHFHQTFQNTSTKVINASTFHLEIGSILVFSPNVLVNHIQT